MRTEKQRSISRGWVVHFVSRHPQFVLKKGKLLDNLRCTACTRLNLLPWFTTYTTLMQSTDYDSRLIFNTDETSVNILDQCHSKLLERTDDSRVPVIPKAERYASTTLVITVTSYGSALTSVLLWPQATVPNELVDLRSFNIAIIANSSGWQTKSSFEQMMLEAILPQMVQRRKDLHLTDKQILLIIDGHHSRLSLLFIYACIRWRITVLVIPAHTSSEVQPNDCGINGVFKTVFTKECYRRTTVDRKPPTTPIDQSDQQQLVVPQTIPPHKRYSYARLSKAEILKALNASEKDIGLPALFDQYEFDTDSTRSQRQRKILVEVIPLALEKVLSISTIASAWKTAGLLPVDTGKDSVLSKLPEGTVPTTPSRSYPIISGRILTSPELLTEMWEWQIRKQKGVDKEQYLHQTLTSIYDVISQTEDQFKSLFTLKEITQEEIKKEALHQLEALEGLKRRRTAEQQSQKTTQSDKSDLTVSSDTRKELVILGKAYDISQLQMIRRMTDEQYSNFISALRCAQEDLLNPSITETNTQTSKRNRKKRPRTELFEEPPPADPSTNESDQPNLERRYRTRRKKSKREADDFYDESEVEILLETQPT